LINPGDEKDAVHVPKNDEPKTINPLFAYIVIGIAFFYLIVLIFQVAKARNRRRAEFEYTDSSEYSDLEASDSSRHLCRRDLEPYDSVPNTCSYDESQMITPKLSVYSVEHNPPPLPRFAGSFVETKSENSFGVQDIYDI